MTELDLTPRFEDGDTFYKDLVDAIDSVDEEQAVSLLIRLVLILANQVGDQVVLREAIAKATQAAEVETPQRSPVS